MPWHDVVCSVFRRTKSYWQRRDACCIVYQLRTQAVQTNTPRAYSSMFEGGTHVADAAAAAYGQSLFGQQAAPPPTRYMQQSPVSGRSGGGSMNFPPRWPQNNGRSQFTRQSLDSMHPQVPPLPSSPNTAPFSQPAKYSSCTIAWMTAVDMCPSGTVGAASDGGTRGCG